MNIKRFFLREKYETSPLKQTLSYLILSANQSFDFTLNQLTVRALVNNSALIHKENNVTFLHGS